ncbi:MAG TPA: hypothetical protein VE575_04555 [Acidimicrobiales bacterium]|nr:hypothetical protein [Acidimicrobiales bacterium]
MGRGDGSGSWGRAHAVMAVLASVVGVAALVAVPAFAVEEADPGEAGDRVAAASGASGSTTTAPATTTTTTTTTTAPTTTAPPEWRPVAAPDASFRAELPAQWVHAAFSGDARATGAAMFPDSRNRATKVTQFIEIFITPQTQVVAVDGSQVLGLEPWMPDMLVVEGRSGLVGLTYPNVLQAARDFPGGATYGAEGRLDSVVGEIAWLELEDPAPRVDAIRYFVIHADELWRLTFWTTDLSSTRPMADRIAASFDPR